MDQESPDRLVQSDTTAPEEIAQTPDNETESDDDSDFEDALEELVAAAGISDTPPQAQATDKKSKLENPFVPTSSFANQTNAEGQSGKAKSDEMKSHLTLGPNVDNKETLKDTSALTETSDTAKASEETEKMETRTEKEEQAARDIVNQVVEAALEEVNKPEDEVIAEDNPVSGEQDDDDIPGESVCFHV